MNEFNHKPTIVLVDDEEMVLTSIRSLLEMESDYKVKTFTSPVKAVQYIEDNGVHLVISDYLMEEMDGITFLAEVKKIKPDIPRIIITGYADKENAIKAINEVGLFQYIEKPWDNNDLLLKIRNGVEKFELIRRLQNKISKLDIENSVRNDIYEKMLATFV
tara:strand:- start:2258 stop:2740 length:483 start_codon:yes stop_codon:yes gene_type:complete